MFSDTTRPDSVICKEWTKDHRTREPKQYIEGHESFHAVRETDEMYRAWCAQHKTMLSTLSLCSHLSEEAPAREVRDKHVADESSINVVEQHSRVGKRRRQKRLSWLAS